MFAQDWSSTTNWCNPPFAVIPRVLALLRAQRATAAVLLPLDADEWWSALVDTRVPVVQAVLVLRSADVIARGQVAHVRVSCNRTSPKRFAIVFFDFGRAPPSRSFHHNGPAAESLPNRLCPPKTFLRMHTACP